MKRNFLHFLLFVLFPVGSDTFVEVGMPRSPSHSANGNELKQMLASCKTSSGKRQAVELLQGTKNSHLQYVHTQLSGNTGLCSVSLCQAEETYNGFQSKLLIDE